MRALYVIVLLLFLLSGSFLAAIPVDSALEAYFSESFDSFPLDSEKWDVENNVNGGEGGAIDFSDGYVCLSSFGTSYPMICTNNNPFPTGDWSLEVQITYILMSHWSAGIRVTQEPSGQSSSQLTFLQLCNDASDGLNIYFLNQLVFNSPTAYDNNIVKLDYRDGIYRVYLNGEIIASREFELKPNHIIIGFPPLTGALDGVPRDHAGQWASFSVDDIKVYQNEPISSQTPDANTPSTIKPTDNYRGTPSPVVTILEIIAISAIVSFIAFALPRIQKQKMTIA